MALHFMAVLGVSLYEPVYYKDESFVTGDERQFIQSAILEKYKQELLDNNGKITIFLTDNAKSANYYDREYTDRDVDIAKKWNTYVKDKVIVGNVKTGLKSEIEKVFGECDISVNSVGIPDGKDEKEIWQIYNIMYEAIEFEENIVFDITHGFRTLPTIALSVVNYAKSIKKCNLQAIHYGAFEASEIIDDGNGEKKIAPIFNMTPFNDIMEWSNAADDFIKYGNASQLRTMLNTKMENANQNEKRKWESIEEPVKCAEALSKALQTGRGIGTRTLNGKEKNLKSIKGAYDSFRQLPLKQMKPENEIQPIYKVLIEAKNNYKVFEVGDNYKVGLAVVKWCIDNGMIQQGYTALEESIVTYLCKIYNLDDVSNLQREQIAKRAITLIGMYAKDKQKKPTLRRQKFFDDKFINDRKLKNEEVRILKRIYNELPEKLGLIFDDIRNSRNDINHFGIRVSPKSYNELENDLAIYYNKIIKIINKWKD